MARGKDNAAERPVFPDKAARCRRRQNAVLADHDLAETVGCRHFENDLYGNGIEKTSVPSQNKGLALITGYGIENGLDEIFQIMRLTENRHGFPQSGCPRILVFERGSTNCLN